MLFRGSSAFTHVMACTLAESPNNNPLHRKLRQLSGVKYSFRPGVLIVADQTASLPALPFRFLLGRDQVPGGRFTRCPAPFTAHFFAN